jgi:hypothetical protein
VRGNMTTFDVIHATIDRFVRRVPRPTLLLSSHHDSERVFDA